MKNRTLCAVLAAMISLPIFIGSASAGDIKKDFVFSVDLHGSEVQTNAFDTRLKREARTYCRAAFRRVGASGVVSGCQRAIVKAVKQAATLSAAASGAEHAYHVNAQRH